MKLGFTYNSSTHVSFSCEDKLTGSLEYQIYRGMECEDLNDILGISPVLLADSVRGGVDGIKFGLEGVNGILTKVRECQ